MVSPAVLWVCLGCALQFLLACHHSGHHLRLSISLGTTTCSACLFAYSVAFGIIYLLCTILVCPVPGVPRYERCRISKLEYKHQNEWGQRLPLLLIIFRAV